MGFLGLLTIVFVIAKITGYLAWSWWFVFLPVLLPAVGFVVLAAFAVIAVLLTNN